jgi:hypothetical protein
MVVHYREAAYNFYETKNETKIFAMLHVLELENKTMGH